MARPETLSLMWVIVCLTYLKVVRAQEQVKELHMYKVVLNAELLMKLICPRFWEGGSTEFQEEKVNMDGCLHRP
jgi:hypothetical protein